MIDHGSLIVGVQFHTPQAGLLDSVQFFFNIGTFRMDSAVRTEAGGVVYFHGEAQYTFKLRRLGHHRQYHRKVHARTGHCFLQALQGSVTVYRMVFHALKERHCPGRNLIRIHMGMYINHHKLSSLLFFFHSTSFCSVLQEENLPFFNIFPIQNRKCILTFRKEYVKLTSKSRVDGFLYGLWFSGS